jgi:hypothetical protein
MWKRSWRAKGGDGSAADAIHSAAHACAPSAERIASAAACEHKQTRPGVRSDEESAKPSKPTHKQTNNKRKYAMTSIFALPRAKPTQARELNPLQLASAALKAKEELPQRIRSDSRK